MDHSAKQPIERMPLASRLIFTFLALAMPLGAHLPDYNATHMFNPGWPPHAKFHTGQTLAMSLALGACTIAFAWRVTAERRTLVLAAAGFSALYWVTQAAAIAYPGTAFFDPEQNTPANHLLGLPIQILIDVFFLGLTGIAGWIALRRGARWRPA